MLAIGIRIANTAVNDEVRHILYICSIAEKYASTSAFLIQNNSQYLTYENASKTNQESLIFLNDIFKLHATNRLFRY